MDEVIQTTDDYTLLFLRMVAGIIIFPYGMQKLLGWFDDFGGGVGIQESLKRIKQKNIPASVGWLIIIGQSFGSIALILGCLGRVAALGNFIIFTGAMITHSPDGWTMNWTGKKKGKALNSFYCCCPCFWSSPSAAAAPFQLIFCYSNPAPKVINIK